MTSHSLKDAAIEFLTLLASGKMSDAYERHIAAGFRHHTPHFHGDATSLKEAKQTNATRNANKVLEVQRALQDGDQVAVFSRVRQHPDGRGDAVVHIFRFQENQIAELWDIGQPVPDNSINENGMF